MLILIILTTKGLSLSVILMMYRASRSSRVWPVA